VLELARSALEMEKREEDGGNLAAPGMDAEAWMGQQAAAAASWERVHAALGFGHKCDRGLGQLGRWRTVAC